MTPKISSWFESLSNAITDGKVADILRTQISLIETQRDDATLRASKAEALILVLQDENKKLHAELADFRKAARPSDSLPAKCLEALNLLFDAGGQGEERALFSRLGCTKSEGDYFLDILTERDFVYIPGMIISDFAPEPPKEVFLTKEGRAYAMQNRQ